MKTTVYLVLDKKGVVRHTKKPPSLQGDQRAVAIDIEVDDTVFEYSFMRTSMTITEDDIIEPSLEVQLIHDVEKRL